MHLIPHSASRAPHSPFRVPHSVFLLALALAVFGALALYQIELPGLHNDEAREAGLLAVQLVRGLPIDAFRGVGIGARGYPLMVQDYIGALNVYLTAPAIALLGTGAPAVRFVSVLIGMAGIVTTFGLARALFGQRAGLIAAGLLAVQPSYLFWNRQGVLVASLTIPLAAGLIWLGAAWARRGGWNRALAAGLVAGVGIYAKLLFIWVLGAFASSLLLVNMLAGLRAAVQGAPLQWWPRRPTAAEGLAAVGGFVAGMLPLLVYNVRSGGTLFSVGANLSTSFYGVDNLAFGPNLLARWDQFRAVIAGRDHLWYLGGSAGNPLWEWALGAAVAVVAWQVVRQGRGWRAALALLLALPFGIAQSAFTVSGLFPTHFAIFTPLWTTIVAGAAAALLGHRLGMGPVLRRIVQTATVIGLLALAGRDVAVDVYYHRRLAATGGLGVHSDAIYRLVDELERLSPPAVVAMDWGFAPQVQQLTENRIAPQEIFGYTWAPDAEFANRLAPYLQQPGSALVFHWANETIFPRKEAFEALAKQAGVSFEQVSVVSRRDGAPIYEIFIVNTTEQNQ